MTVQPLPTTSLLRRAELLSQGLSDNRIRKARSDGALTTIAPGIYLNVDELLRFTPVARHRAQVWALLPGLAGQPVVSHLSAAIVHGLTKDSDRAAALLPAPVHISRPGPAKSRRGPLLQVHRARFTAPEVVQVQDVAVTSVPRTVLDCAFDLPFEAAVDVASAALTAGVTDARELTEQLGRHTRTPGRRRAAGVLESAGVNRSP